MMCAYWLQKLNHVMRISESLECILAKCQPDPPWKMIECPRKSSEANKSDFTPIFLNNTWAKSSSLSSNLKMLLQPLKTIPKQAHSLLAIYDICLENFTFRMFILVSDIIPIITTNSFGTYHLSNALLVYSYHFHGSILSNFPKHAVTIYLSEHEGRVEG